MKHLRRYLTLFACLTVLVACRGGRQATPPPGGTLSLERTVVEHGTAPDALAPLAQGDRIPFAAGDFIRVRDGGRAVLEFPDSVSLRIFDDTELEVLVGEFAEDVPLDFQLVLAQGDLIGELTGQGGQVVVQTPTGAEITVLGTEFFISYNSSSQEMSAGNFDGTLTVATPGMSSGRSIGDGHYVTWTPGSSLSSDKNIPYTYQDFQSETDRMGGIPAVLAGAEQCIDDSHFISETLDPPGGRYQPGQAIRMTWRIENSGTCPWPLPGYMVRSASAEPGHDGIEVPVLFATEPGETVEVSDLIAAHFAEGSYQIDWQMVNPAGESFGDVWTTRFTVSGPTLAPTNTPPPTPTATLTPTAAPLEGLLTYGNSLGLYLSRPDGSQIQPLKVGGIGPDFSPTGQYITYSNPNPGESGGDHVYIYDLVGGDQFDISGGDSPYSDRDPAWAPNNEMLVMSSNRDDEPGQYSLYLIGFSGEVYDQLVSTDGSDEMPAWSPDSRWVVFTSDVTGARNLFAVQVSTRDVVQLTYYDGGEARYPSWSPDGQFVAYSYRSSGSEDIYVVNVGATFGKITQVTAGGSFAAPDWSLDGAYMIFVGPGGYYLLPTSGQNTPQQVVGVEGSPGLVDWGPLYTPNRTLPNLSTQAPLGTQAPILPLP